MPRYARILSNSQVYHVMLRGNNREDIFIDDDDKTRIIDTLREKKQAGEFYLYAYCVMDNHIHLVIKEGTDSLSRIIKRIGTSYAYYFNKKYMRIGHVFQDRFRSEIVDDDKYLLSLIRYVHQNPLKPGIGIIEGYRWSSYREYSGQKADLVETDEILSMFSSDEKKAIEEFIRFNHETTEELFLDVEEEKEIDQTNVKEHIDVFLKMYKIEMYQLRDRSKKDLMEELIRLLTKKSNLSGRGIAIELGLSRETVRRIVSKEPSP